MKIAGYLKVALPFIWLGAVSSISFMEAPLKFSAPNLSVPVALEVGHIVFDALNKVEWVLAALLGTSLLITKPLRHELSGFGLIFAVLIVQTFWLYPILDERTLAIINSQPVTESNYHLVFIVLELCKVILLLALGVVSLRNLKTKKDGTR